MAIIINQNSYFHISIKMQVECLIVNCPVMHKCPICNLFKKNAFKVCVPSAP